MSLFHISVSNSDYNAIVAASAGANVTRVFLVGALVEALFTIWISGEDIHHHLESLRKCQAKSMRATGKMPSVVESVIVRLTQLGVTVE